MFSVRIHDVACFCLLFKNMAVTSNSQSIDRSSFRNECIKILPITLGRQRSNRHKVRLIHHWSLLHYQIRSVHILFSPLHDTYKKTLPMPLLPFYLALCGLKLKGQHLLRVLFTYRLIPIISSTGQFTTRCITSHIPAGTVLPVPAHKGIHMTVQLAK